MQTSLIDTNRREQKCYKKKIKNVIKKILMFLYDCGVSEIHQRFELFKNKLTDVLIWREELSKFSPVEKRVTNGNSFFYFFHSFYFFSPSPFPLFSHSSLCLWRHTLNQCFFTYCWSDSKWGKAFKKTMLVKKIILKGYEFKHACFSQLVREWVW